MTRGRSWGALKIVVVCAMAVVAILVGLKVTQIVADWRGAGSPARAGSAPKRDTARDLAPLPPLEDEGAPDETAAPAAEDAPASIPDELFNAPPAPPAADPIGAVIENAAPPAQ